jgi:hypothetical protein
MQGHARARGESVSKIVTPSYPIWKGQNFSDPTSLRIIFQRNKNVRIKMKINKSVSNHLDVCYEIAVLNSLGSTMGHNVRSQRNQFLDDQGVRNQLHRLMRKLF